MPDTTQLPFLLKLLDDESDEIRSAILHELNSYGTALEDELAVLENPPDTDGLRQIRAMLENFRKQAELDARPVYPPFEVGDIVRHVRYGYRGVVVHRDMVCEAGDDWYSRNQSQPDRDQPWYYVLVDRSRQITYAAHSSLGPDGLDRPIEHVMVEYYFDGLYQGRYIRNDTPWDPARNL
jgi:heat shock protein HspQ